MRNFSFKLSNIQHIRELNFDIDLSRNQLMCIVGKNGVGKTTLIRSIANLKSADTFQKTASPHIFCAESSIVYHIDDETYVLNYNSNLQVIDTKSIILDEIKNNIFVELPLPHGERFYHFQRLSNIDGELRRKISLEDYTSPTELINYLANIYLSDRFNNLKEIEIGGKKYYFILKADRYYIREDYLSSGEYFVINLYKMIQLKCQLIVIDEIDISLDASAQANLITELRGFCQSLEVNIIFTTHSLALMNTLEDSELYYMENDDHSMVTLQRRSYSFIKSLLFGFKGWDKYILTEDKVLNDYLEYMISKVGVYYKYKIIFIGGATNVVDLMARNAEEHFFSAPENVICILDGDQRDKAYCRDKRDVCFIPFESVEKDLLEYHDKKLNDGLPFVEIDPNIRVRRKPKALYRKLLRNTELTQQLIFDYLNGKEAKSVDEFSEMLSRFLR